MINPFTKHVEYIDWLYRVEAGGADLTVYPATVSAIPFNTVWPGHQRPISQTEKAAFVQVDIDRFSEVTVTPLFDFDKAVLRPLHRCSQPVKNADGSLTVSLPGPGQYSLECDGYHAALTIFADSMSGLERNRRELDRFAADDRGVLCVSPPDSCCCSPGCVTTREELSERLPLSGLICFAPGSYDVGALRLSSGQALFVPAGAVLYGGIIIEDAEDVRIYGGGIIDNSRIARGDVGGNCLRAANSKNIDVRDITFRDSAAWTAYCQNCENLYFNNVKLIGMWRYNSDGIDFCNSKNCCIMNSYLRCFDDCVVIKGLGADNPNCENILVSGCTIWCDWGRGLEIGAETRADEMKNMRFENCDIIHNTHIAMDIQNGDRGKVSDIVFSDIRVEYDPTQLAPVYQHSDDMIYEGKEGFIPDLIVAHVYHGMWSKDEAYGSNTRLRFEGIRLYMPEEMEDILTGENRRPLIRFEGYNEDHLTSDIVVEGIFINGKRISGCGINVKAEPFTKDIVIR